MALTQVTAAGLVTTESNLTLANTTTNDVSTAKHGFVPVAPNDSTKFLRGDATWAAPTVPAYTLLYSNTGSSANNSATNLDTYTFSGLTAKDKIVIYAEAFGDGGGSNINGFSLYHVGGSRTLISASGNSSQHTIDAVLRYISNTYGGLVTTGIKWDSSAGAGVATPDVYGISAAAYASWTIALRSGGITPNTTGWQWTIYKIAGQ